MTIQVFLCGQVYSGIAECWNQRRGLSDHEYGEECWARRLSEKENYFLLRDLELSRRLYFSDGCRRKKTIGEEGLCRIERGNSSKVHAEIERFIYPTESMSHRDETSDESSDE